MTDSEPTVLDYVKSLLTPWKGRPIPIPPLPEEGGDAAMTGELLPQEAPPSVDGTPPPAAALAPQEELLPAGDHRLAEERPAVRLRWPWPSLVALGLGLLAQVALRPRPERSWEVGLAFYLWAAAWLFWSNLRGEWLAAPLPADEPRHEPQNVRLGWLVASIPLALAAFLLFGGNRFNSLNLALWGASLVCLLIGLWLPRRAVPSWPERLWMFVRTPQWRIAITRSTLIALALGGVVLFFRLYRLTEVPPEMVSDQAEKLLDIWDVLHGQTQIFFPRNTGREALQMYLTAAIIKYLGTGYSYLSLKIGTALAGLLTLPYIYLLGREVANRRVGLLAFFFAGIAYWPNVISRVGLRFPLYPLFVAPALYYLIRGLRRRSRNDFILAGLALGIGLHGYTPIRILPFVIVAAVGLYLLHAQARGGRRQAILGLAIVAIVSAYVFLPLMRYAVDFPESFSFRAFSRVGSVEQPLPAPAWLIFTDNLWRAMTMFAWDDGEIWVHSVTHRPALDTFSAVLFYLGMALLLFRYLRGLIALYRRWRNERGGQMPERQDAALPLAVPHWLDLFLVLSVPLLMMPSILSLAFPAENPALNRASGAIVTVFVIVAIALDGLLTALEARAATAGRRVATVLAIVIMLLACRENYDLVFQQYAQSYTGGAWNTSEMGEVVATFSTLMGSSDTVWVVAYPYWVDTRLVGMNAGLTTRDMAIWPDQIAETLGDTRMKLFLLNREDVHAQEVLRQLYPQGQLSLYRSRVGKNFLLYLVPPSELQPPFENLLPPNAPLDTPLFAPDL